MCVHMVGPAERRAHCTSVLLEKEVARTVLVQSKSHVANCEPGATKCVLLSRDLVELIHSFFFFLNRCVI